MKIKTLETIYLVLNNYWLTFEIPTAVSLLFEEYIGHELNLEDLPNEIKLVSKKITKMNNTLGTIIDNMKEPENKMDFQTLVANVDSICGLNGNLGIMKLYKLPFYIDKSYKIIKSKENG